MGAFFILVPILISGVIAFLFDRCKEEYRNARPGRLPLMLILTVILSAAGIFGYYLGAFGLSFVTDSMFHAPFNTLVLLFCMAVMAYLLLLLARGLALLLALTKKNRTISLLVMILLMLAETYILYVCISGSLI